MPRSQDYLSTIPFTQIDAGVGETSQSLSAVLARARRESARSVVFGWRERLKAEIADVYKERTTKGWDGYKAKPILPEAVKAALYFVNTLPDNIIEPDIVPETNGTISLEWRIDNNNVISVELNQGSIVYAGILDSRIRKHGQEPLSSRLPEGISTILASHFRKAELDQQTNQ